uniref:HAUS augmin-like complex subunit 3 N-terminal domain-containing protein n=1 Tax=Biomphalaria glabrata TaxID=6526 RepID=A0A2C9KZC6_BIOGL
MSAQSFIDTLKRIGYPKAAALDPNSFEWAFENETTFPFLKWICDNISEENVLSSEELRDYEAIQNNGITLKGAELEEALNLLVVEDEENSVKTVEEDEEHVKNSLLKAKAQKEILKARCNKLNLHQMALSNKISKMEVEEGHLLKSFHQLKDKCSSQNQKIDEAVDKLMASICSLSDLYKQSTELKKGEGQTADETVFLSQMDLKGFHEVERKYSQELTKLTKKLFFEGVADMTGERDASQYGLLDASFPEQANVSMEEKESFIENCQEFARLQKIFPKSECDRINALINARKALSAVNEARSILHQIKSGQFPMSPSEISRLQHNTEQNIENVKAEAVPYTTSLSNLLRELGGLQGTEILTGDYNLKLKRQDYFNRNQDKVIDHLLAQRGRNEFLAMLYEVETRCHNETYVLLVASREMLEKNLQEWKQRMNDLEDPDLNAAKFKRSVVDARDTSSVRLYHLLTSFFFFQVTQRKKKNPLLTKKKVLDAAVDLQEQLNNAKAISQAVDEKYLSKIVQLEHSIKNCETRLYAGSSTSSGMPYLSPVEVQSTMAALIAKFSTLVAEIDKVIEDVTAKKNVLKSNAHQRKERELFTLFHNNPKGLQDLMSALGDRIEGSRH